MCGIFGIIGSNDIKKDLANGLHSLEHRGPQSSGYITLNSLINGRFNILKSQGLAKHAAKKNEYCLMTGTAGIGHTGYSTTGKGGIQNSQPCAIETLGLALAHNGHVINKKELNEALEKKGFYHKTDNDCETILNLFAYYFINNSSGNKKQRVFESVEKVMQKIIGSYSAVGIVKDVGLIAFRDPHGFRPHVIGIKNSKEGEKIAFASETIAFQQSGFKYLRPVERGEAIIIDENLQITSRIIIQKEKKICPFEYFYFSDAFSFFENIRVNEVRGKAGIFLIEDNPWLKGDVDVVQAVPYSAIPAAQEIGEKIGAKTKQGIYKYRFGGRIFLGKSQDERLEDAKKEFMVIPEIFENKNVLVVDDSIVRGTNSKVIVEILKDISKKVYFASTFPKIIGSCFYGINTPTKEELAAHNKSDEEIRQIIGAPDKLIYQKPERVHQAIGCKENEICTACYTCKYPTKIKGEKIEL